MTDRDCMIGWGACSLRACSDRLFEGLSLQAFVVVFGSLLDLHFCMLVSWFCQSPSAARGLRYRKWPFAKEQCFGGFGGVSPPL